MSLKEAKDWRDAYKKPGTIAMCMDLSWLKGGCPMCGGKRWEVTSDYWAYCLSCKKGYPTAYPFVSGIGGSRIEIIEF